MALRCDVLVVGLGAMGSAAAFHLARRGVSVAGLDKFAPPHDNGSSHGQSRIIREAYFEHPAYVPLVRSAYELWQALEAETGQSLLRITGGVMLGHPDSVLVKGALHSAREHSLPHDVLSAAEVRKRFPILKPPDEMVGVYEPRAGVLFPEICVAAHLQMAQRHGAMLRFNEPLKEWRFAGNGVEVITAKERYLADALVLSVGAWLPTLLPSLPLEGERIAMFWFRPAHNAEHFVPDRCPIYIWEHAPQRFFYGFPDFGDGVKVAKHHEGERCTPDTARRTVDEHEVNDMRRLLMQFMPAANGELVRARTCLYTNTPDGHFLIDRHPDHPQVWLVSPCSGHGFKFASVIGELVADLVTTGTTRHDINLFRLQRLTM